MTDQTSYVRFQSPTPDSRGRYVGVFGLVNSLAKQGRLTAEQEQFRRTNNDWYDHAYPDPGAADPTIYDHTLNPGSAAWFKSTATTLTERITGYIDILAAHQVECVRRESTSPPGKVIYEDEYQIVVVPSQPHDAQDPAAVNTSEVDV